MHNAVSRAWTIRCSPCDGGGGTGAPCDTCLASTIPSARVRSAGMVHSLTALHTRARRGEGLPRHECTCHADMSTT